MASVHFQAVTKSYDGKNRILQPLDITINEGEFMVMVGPSGCGKSTLLRMVAGLETVSSGDIYIDQRCVTRLEPKERGIAMVFQNYALYPHMTVEQNMGYGLKIRGMGKEQIRQRVLNAARSLELDALLTRHPRELSGGQRQRVAMGRAIVREPSVFLFDEPLSNLDARLRSQMRLELQQLHQRLNTTSLYVTHDQVEAMTLAQRVMVMNKGVVEQVGTPSQVYEKPATTFVAGFIGSPAMNLLPGKVSADGRELVIDPQCRIFLAEQQPALANQLVTLGIRPEHIQTVAQSASAIAMQVETLEILGADNLVHGKIGGQRLVVRLPHEQRPAAGTLLWLDFPYHGRHLFNTTTGLRLE
ncbi:MULTISPECIES: sn-glycerol-3-phosphate import ATP-binding protein UgpC [unclassified Tatumella]|uniref:sn-glycerol-3-phosphate import ATP-binding protein UgpC n=1 Tax=unclassified Tatumella TaxID=2649542 RepID=UPI001BAF2FDE|nr:MULTISPECIES: sn-glycerol-3-phosphate import ATP-binding protein UgpC [unclassified Tatumella]MBS0855668.1 sn-glycerol-3-phosphate import ATP-binding protein UgpC [Tatumella sp. JGM16]MBS0912445.1 sn-glycerol-3-phosphate import ATP-binding protein UgpC [Tatumella sp. JGM91]